jgi:hypothetical protein
VYDPIRAWVDRRCPVRSAFLFLLVACSPNHGETGPADDTGGSDLYGEVSTTGGDCEGEAFAAPVPAVWAETAGSDILLHLDDLTANCCPTPGTTVTLADTTFTVVFDDLAGGGGCWCECVIDFLVTIEDVAAGTWTLDVEYRGAALGSAEVTVP